MASSSAPLWEASKENAAPLQRGRNIHALETSLQTDSPARRQEKEKMLQHYEALVRPSEDAEQYSNNTDTDPLIHWLSYIKFHQDAFPSDTHAQFLLMERCTRALLHRKEYKHDVRFIRVCVTYADKTSSPANVFQYLHQHCVGTETALFWMAWAWVAEKRGDYDFADKVFRKGIQKRAKPLEKLQQRHRQFQRRFAKHVLQQQQQEEEEEYIDDGSGRGTLAGLTEDRVRRNDRRVVDSTDENHAPTFSLQRRTNNNSSTSSATFIDRTMVDRRHDRPDLNNNNNNHTTTNAASGFEIFVDDSHDNGGYNLDQSHVQQHDTEDDGDYQYSQQQQQQRMLERDEDRRKENTAAAERWNDRGGLGDTSAQRAGPSEPSFAVYMDEECTAKVQREERHERARQEQARHARDERTLQQRTEQDIAEKLARDPMRYVRNPSKLSTDQQPHHQGHAVAPSQDLNNNIKSSLSCGFDKRLVSKDSNGQECCFQEGRARANSYRLVTDATQYFNLLATISASKRDDSTMDVSMESASDVSFSSSVRQRHTPMTLFSNNRDDSSSFHANNLSTASSTVNESYAVGIPKEEETINTKLAMKELSMMFSSPAMGLGGSDVEAIQEEDGDGDTATFSLVNGLVDDHAADNSILIAGEDNDDENNGQARNPNARHVDNKDVHQDALHMLDGDQDDRVGDSTGRGVQQPTAASGFSIFCDDDDDGTQGGAAFEIYQDTRESVGDTATFSVLASALQTCSPVGAARMSTAAAATGGFEMFNDKDDDKRSSGGDTATFSLLGDALKPSAPPVASSAATSFHIHKDETDTNDCEGDTATFSVFGNAMTTLKDGKAAASGFSIYADDDSKTDDFKKYQPPQAAGSPEFGDISRIVADEYDLTTFRRAPVSSPPRPRESEEALVMKDSLNYSQVHKNSVRAALRQLQVEARQHAIRGDVRPPDIDLTRVLSTKGFVDDMPQESVPRVLLQSSSAKGAVVSLGNLCGIVKEELGKGTYGKVVLLESNDDPSVIAVAVKAQAPTDCLGLEYAILKALQERIEPHCKGHFPFPRALSFVSVGDGALLGMTNASTSGINLVDLVNVYKVLEDTPVPELIALHYTVLMLKIIETLHWHGKILHCDAKPDNWVLSTSDSAFEGCTEEIPGSGLMLVDFGRAIDLTTTAAKSGTDAMNVVLQGSASNQEMECVAMRKGLGWSFDADTFGVCAGAHALLFGTHIEIDFNRSTRRWMPRKPLRRYWKKALWTDFFDTLLNLDKVSQTALGSRPGSLRDLRKKMESHVQTRTSELESLLRHQGRILPSQRIT